MPGDVVHAEVYAKYVDTNSSNWTGALTTLMSQIAANTAGVVVDGVQYGQSTASFPAGFAGLQSTTDNGAPRAYLNWLVFDRNYAFITGGFKQITTAAKEAGTDVAHELIAMPAAITITQPGYVYIYLSNESLTPVEVYFDDLKVTHTKSPVIQQDDYFPFGLTCNSYSRENSVPNKFKFQEQENIDDLRLNWDSFKWRNHQPDIGRFFNVDPLAEKYVYNSPYAFAENRVIDGRELEGLEWMPVNGQGTQVTPTSNEIASYNWVGYETISTAPRGAPYSGNESGITFSVAPAGTVSEGAVMGTQSGVEGATFYSVDTNQQGLTEFSALSGASMSFNGSMNGNIAEGTLKLTNLYENGKTIDVSSQSANSGPWGNGALPNGNYSADQVVSPTYNTGMVVGTNDFAIHLTPNFQTNRDGLYIHPDGGNYVGTLGCIGLTGTANEMQSLRTNVQTRMATQTIIPLNVNITGNPNNQGGNNNNPTVRE